LHEHALRGKKIDESVRLIEDIVEYCNNKKDIEPPILFAADFEKAFDSIEHEFIYAVLKHFGFGDNFITTRISFVKLLYLREILLIKISILLNLKASEFDHHPIKSHERNQNGKATRQLLTVPFSALTRKMI